MTVEDATIFLLSLLPVPVGLPRPSLVLVLGLLLLPRRKKGDSLVLVNALDVMEKASRLSL